MGYSSNFLKVPWDQDSWHGSFLPNYKQLQRSNEKLGGSFLIVSMSCLWEYPWSECVLPLWVQLWEALERFNFSDSLGLTAQEKSFLIVSQFARLTIVYKIFHIRVVCSDESPWQYPGEWEREVENYYPSSSSAMQSDIGIAAKTEICLLLPRHVGRKLSLPTVSHPHGSTGAKWKKRGMSSQKGQLTR